jgi:hypothetical protein
MTAGKAGMDPFWQNPACPVLVWCAVISAEGLRASKPLGQLRCVVCVFNLTCSIDQGLCPTTNNTHCFDLSEGCLAIAQAKPAAADIDVVRAAAYTVHLATAM